MSRRSARWVEVWIEDNVTDASPDDDDEAGALARRCAADAAAQGFSMKELLEEGPLEARMQTALQKIIDREVGDMFTHGD